MVPGSQIRHASLADAQFTAADHLYQVGALDLAAERLESLARRCSDDGIKAIALGRLAEVASDQYDVARSERALREAHRLIERAPGDSPVWEVAVGEVRLALAIADGVRLRGALRSFESPSIEATMPDRFWILRGRALTYAALYAYATLAFGSATSYAQGAAQAFGRAHAVPPRIYAHFLTTQTVIDFHDIERARCIDEECAQAYDLGIEHGIADASAAALFNALIFRLYSGGAYAAAPFSVDRSHEALRGAMEYGDPLLAAAAAASLGEYDCALAKLQLTNTIRREGLKDGEVPVTDFHAQLLYLAGRYTDALEAARAAIRNWKQSGLPVEGIALCIQAQALEALGERDAGRRIIGEAIAALEPLSPVPHLLAAYRCAHRLTGERRFGERVAWLTDSIQPREPRRKSTKLTSREREIAELVIAGRSNPQIGRALGISPRTVATHVASVLRRLDLRARWQIEAEHLRAS